MKDDLQDAIDYIKKRMRENKRAVKKAILRVGSKYEKKIRNKIKEKDIMASQNLYLSVDSELKQKKGNFILTFFLAKYGIYVEEGTKPHYPPLKPIVNWVEQRRIKPDNLKKGQSLASAQKSIAVAIQKKIGKEGTKKQEFIKPVFKKFENKMIRELKKELEDAA